MADLQAVHEKPRFIATFAGDEDRVITKVADVSGYGIGTCFTPGGRKRVVFFALADGKNLDTNPHPWSEPVLKIERFE